METDDEDCSVFLLSDQEAGQFLEEEQELLEDSFELRDRPEKEISQWWKTSVLISYFMTAIGGLISSISIDDLVTAFHNRCIFYSKLSLIKLEALKGSRTLLQENISEDKWGDLYDCQLCEFGSLFSVVFSGMLFAMFLQCGKGGVTFGRARSWEIVPLALLINIIFFIFATVILAKTTGGLAFFCNYILKGLQSPENITSCKDVFSYNFPYNENHYDLYLENVLAQLGVSLTFVGWFAALSILIFRCLLGVDFVAYRKKSFAIVKTMDKSSSNRTVAKKGSYTMTSELPMKKMPDSSETSSEESEEETETSFVNIDSRVETKKLI